MLIGHFPNRIKHATNRIHHIPEDAIIVTIKTNTIPIITIKSITFSFVIWVVFCFFFQQGNYGLQNYNSLFEKNS